MNPFREDMRIVQQRLVTLLQGTSLPLSNCRRLALLESCKEASDGRALLDMTMESLMDSEVIDPVQKDSIMNSVMAGDWNTVQQMVSAPAPLQPEDVTALDDDDQTSFRCFRRMAIAIFHASRKVQQLPLPARRQLGSTILRTNNREELMNLVFTRLQCAVTLDEEAREKIANDVLEGRYYRLLLPDRFDCEVSARRIRTSVLRSRDRRRNRHSSNSVLDGDSPDPQSVYIDQEPEECPICLGDSETPVTLQCQHVFCRGCIIDWSRQALNGGGDNVSCPICRQISTLGAESQARVPAPVSRRRRHGSLLRLFRATGRP